MLELLALDSAFLTHPSSGALICFCYQSPLGLLLSLLFEAMLCWIKHNVITCAKPSLFFLRKVYFVFQEVWK